MFLCKMMVRVHDVWIGCVWDYSHELLVRDLQHADITTTDRATAVEAWRQLGSPQGAIVAKLFRLKVCLLPCLPLMLQWRWDVEDVEDLAWKEGDSNG